MWILSIPIILLIIKIQQLTDYDVSDSYFYALFSFFAIASVVSYLLTMRSTKDKSSYIIRDGKAGVVVSLAWLAPLVISMRYPTTLSDYDPFIFFISFIPLLGAMHLDTTVFRLCNKDKEKEEEYRLAERKSAKTLLESGIFSIAVFFGVYNYALDWHEGEMTLLLAVALGLFVLNMITLLSCLHRMSDEEGKIALKKSKKNFWKGTIFVAVMLMVAAFILEPEIVTWFALGSFSLSFPVYVVSVFYTVYSNEKKHFETLEKQKEQDKVLNYLDQLVQPVNDEETVEVH
ncbi:hypothetical protein [Spongiibacter tropicus]|uniref:hypothetical protein n=1 Tax=Spongiibacter tropicus TaxID=454602 RepID=UPI00235764F2|nr:hypothetical protein [Spongiibacter tropicus]|tara:strand:+ start:140 stop:1006 length:867 start_codon:yes stop_codon:yes gene_type:complete